MRIRLPILLLFITCACHITNEVSPDQEVWEYELPDAEGLSREALLGVNDLIQLNQFLEINGLVIIKNDKLVFENYYQRVVDSVGVVTRDPTLRKREIVVDIGTAGLIFALSAIGVAEDKRLLSIDDPIDQYLPSYSEIFTDNPEKSEITIAHLLSHRAGLSWDEGIRPFSLENDLNQMKLANDWVRYVLEKPQTAPAGLQYRFNSGTGMILAKIVENVSNQDFETFLKENILDALTISSMEIESDPQGNYNGGDGITITLLDWTKLGYLYLNEGTWNGRRILDPNFVIEASSVQNEISESFSQGYIWQRFGDNFSFAFGTPHDEMYFVRGGLGQLLCVIPEENMIVSIFAENFFFGLSNPSVNLFAEITNSFQ